MPASVARSRIRSWWLRITYCALLTCIADVAQALDVVVVGLFSGRAVVMINGGAPRTLSAGQSTPEGVRLLRADSEAAELEIDGKRQVLRLGGGRYGGGPAADSPSARLYADGDGHFISDGTIVVHTVKLDTMRVGGIELHNVDATVHDGDHPTLVLLGMSFLNRVDMRRDGALLTLTQRY